MIEIIVYNESYFLFVFLYPAGCIGPQLTTPLLAGTSITIRFKSVYAVDAIAVSENLLCRVNGDLFSYLQLDGK